MLNLFVFFQTFFQTLPVLPKTAFIFSILVFVRVSLILPVACVFHRDESFCLVCLHWMLRWRVICTRRWSLRFHSTQSEKWLATLYDLSTVLGIVVMWWTVSVTWAVCRMKMVLLNCCGLTWRLGLYEGLPLWIIIYFEQLERDRSCTQPLCENWPPEEVLWFSGQMPSLPCTTVETTEVDRTFVPLTRDESSWVSRV